MRLRLLPLVVSGAAVVALTATVAAAPGLQPRKVTYNFKATFGVGLSETWSMDEGNRDGSCWETWRHYEGTNEVNGGSSRELRGGIEISPPGRPGKQEVDTWIVGAARATAERRLTAETGGTVWNASCGGTRPAPFRPPPNDCGEKRYSTRLASIRSERRLGKGGVANVENWTLKDWVGSRLNGEEVLSITLSPMSSVFRTCRPGPALEYPVSIGLWVDDLDVRKLRTLKPGARYRVELPQAAVRGKCANDLPDNIRCRYTLEAHVEFRRLRPGES